MKIKATKDISKLSGITVFINQDKRIFQENKLNTELKKTVKEIIEKKEIDTKKQEILSTFVIDKEIKYLNIISLGDEKKLKTDDLRRLAAKASKFFQSKKITDIGFVIPSLKSLKKEQVIREIIEGSILASYEFTKFITDKKRLKSQFKKIDLITEDKSKELNKQIENSKEISLGVLLTRDLINTPPSTLNPSQMLVEAKKIAKETGLKIKCFDQKELLKRGMNCIASVGKGSSEGSKMIILEYKGKKAKNKKPLVLVGKGITYDAGGINLKPSRGGFLESMKDDMGGSAVVLQVIRLAAILKLEINLTAILAVSENMLGASAYKPGDILTAYNGKTVEVKNTDAEGRLAMSDALSYAVKDLKAERVIDIATLTGASIVSLGWDITPVLSNNQELLEKIKKAAQNADEKMWELPLDPCYKKYMKGSISDLQNVPDGMNAGVSTSAVFLEEFVDKDTPWAHIDIGNTVMSKRQYPYEPTGATGSMVRMFIDFLQNY
jgi:leucyl aminopeptidase